jgi:tRNA 2-thiouridine synthesizing protein A
VGVRHTETSLIIWSAGTSETEEGQKTARVNQPTSTEAHLFNADRWYDAGNKGCAAGPMDEIAAIMRQMESGQTLEIFATDPTVPVDLAAWCRMTGHALVEQQNSHYLVNHK